MTTARVMTFHVDKSQMPTLLAALDLAVERFTTYPGFGGFLCLEHDGARQQVTVISLWNTEQMDPAATEEARELIRVATDLGVTNRTDNVLRFVSDATSAPEPVLAGHPAA
jgi:hypothetical protein